MKILVTGFEPFGGSDVNPSEIVTMRLGALHLPGVVTDILPTSFSQAEARISELLSLHEPDSVLMLGLAESTPSIRFEQVALNLDDCEAPDNDGDVCVRRSIAEDAPVGYWSTLPLESMEKSSLGRGEDVLFSRDAGGFVCNHVFFVVAHAIATRYPSSRCGFVHLPATSDSDERLVRFLEIVQAWINDL